jgi:predicted  nucleic acid-binding Zn-ribbon protein
MSKYELVNDQFKDRWINKPNNKGDVGDLQDITDELNRLLSERDEARGKYLKEKEELDKTLDELVEARGRIAGISGQLLCSAFHVGKLEKENAKLRDKLDQVYRDVEINKLKGGEK